MRSLATVTAGALGVWFGVQAIRSFTLAMTWNVAEDHTPQLAMVAGVVWLLGLAAWLPRRLIGRRRPVLVLAVVFGGLAVARQAFNVETFYAAFAMAAVVAWLWWFAAYIESAGRRGDQGMLLPAVLLGLAIQVTGQLLLSGLDVHELIGLGGVAVVAVIVAAWLWLLWRSEAAADEAESAGAGWGVAAVLPFLYLQLTLFVNLGRVELLWGSSLAWAGAMAVLGLGAGAVLTRLELPRPVLIGVAGATVVCVYAATGGGVATSLLIPAQAGLTVLLAAALTAGGRRMYLPFAVGGLLFFGLLFATYYEFSDAWARFAWPIGAAVVGLVAVLSRRAGPASVQWSRSLRLAAPIATLGVLGVVVAWPPLAVIPAAAPAGPIALLNYNLHQGMGRNGVPSLPASGALIEATHPDVLLLQEVNRVWDLSGGVDSYAWLSDRLGAYDSAWAPMHGIHFGLAVFARAGITDWGWKMYPLGPSGTPRSFMWATVETAQGEVLFITTHLTPYNRANEAVERDSQAALLVDFWRSRGSPSMILTGDLNAEPDTATIARLKDAGLLDALEQGGVGDEITFESTGNLFAPPSREKLDYVFITPDLLTLTAEIIDNGASDHNAMYVEIERR